MVNTYFIRYKRTKGGIKLRGKACIQDYFNKHSLNINESISNINWDRLNSNIPVITRNGMIDYYRFTVKDYSSFIIKDFKIRNNTTIQRNKNLQVFVDTNLNHVTHSIHQYDLYSKRKIGTYLILDEDDDVIVCFDYENIRIFTLNKYLIHIPYIGYSKKDDLKILFNIRNKPIENYSLRVMVSKRRKDELAIDMSKRLAKARQIYTFERDINMMNLMEGFLRKHDIYI